MTIQAAFDSPITRDDKRRTFRMWQSGDLVQNRRRDRTGMVLAVYSEWVWVRWDDAGQIKGNWQPDTEYGRELEFVGESCHLCGKSMGDEEGRTHGACADYENAANY